MSALPSITVLVPTRERCATLESTLRTCVAQQYEALTILVSDNCSQDRTREVVASFTDPRIRYINTGQRLSMTGNWEFALGQVDSEFVTIIGDDDGLLPGAAADVAGILGTAGTKAVTWLKSEYCWPNHAVPGLRNLLQVPLRNQLTRMDARRAARDAARLLLGYNKTPCLYNSCVSVALLQTLKSRTGRYLHGPIPDIYSGFALLSVVGEYLYSSRPFSVNGASARSIGTAQWNARPDAADDPFKQFVQELDSQDETFFGLVTGSTLAAVVESLHQANARCFEGKLHIPSRRAVKRIFGELARLENGAYEASLGQLREAARRQHLLGYFESLLGRAARRRSAPAPAAPAFTEGLDGSDLLSIDAARFGVSSVMEACTLVHQLLGPYRAPARTASYFGVISKVMSRSLRLVQRLPFDRSF